MPAQPFCDLNSLDFAHPALNLDDVRKVNPQRFEFEMLSGILFVDEQRGLMAAWKDLTMEDFWVRGHIPGRPLFPGVLMIEAAAQMSSYYISKALGGDKFVGFGGVDAVKFRGQVIPPCRFVLLGQMVEMRPRRAISDCQGFVDGKMVFEGRITGMPF